MKARSLLLVLLTIIGTACGGPEERKAKYVSLAQEYIEASNYPKARVALRNVLKIDPKDAEAYYLFARVEEKENRHKGRVLISALKLIPGLPKWNSTNRVRIVKKRTQLFSNGRPRIKI